MNDEMIWLGKDGWPVEHIEGRWFTNWLRDRIHGKRKVNRREWEYYIDKLHN